MSRLDVFAALTGIAAGIALGGYTDRRRRERERADRYNLLVAQDLHEIKELLRFLR